MSYMYVVKEAVVTTAAACVVIELIAGINYSIYICMLYVPCVRLSFCSLCAHSVVLCRSTSVQRCRPLSKVASCQIGLRRERATASTCFVLALGWTMVEESRSSFLLPSPQALRHSCAWYTEECLATLSALRRHRITAYLVPCAEIV